MMHSVYEIVHIATGRRYVGSTIDTEKRWKTHKRDLQNGKHHCAHLQNLWRRDGNEAFTFSVLEIVSDKQHLTAVEQVFIDYFRGFKKLLNSFPYARSCLGYAQNAEIKAKRSASLLGHPTSQETRKKIAEKRRGVLASQRTKELMSKVKKGKPQPIDSVRKRWRPVVGTSHTGIKKLYPSIKAVVADGFVRSSVSNCLAGRLKDHRGFIWTYAEDQ